MPLKSQAEGVRLNPGTATNGIPDPASIREQLDRLLASPHRRNSKRCQALLKHVVEAHLEGGLDRVKERCIGFEVFQRDPDYDTSHDSIVRTTAGEVRKRLAQYYLEPEHEREIRFALPRGSYAPEFHVPAADPLVVSEPVMLAAPRRRVSRRSIFAVGVLAVATLTLVGYIKTRPTEFDRFWMPLSLANVKKAEIRNVKVTGLAGPLVAVHNVSGKGLEGAASVELPKLPDPVPAPSQPYQSR